MWIRRLYRRGDSVMVTIPKAVRVQAPWAHVSNVEIFYEPPVVIIRPLPIEELMRRPRAEGEDLTDDAPGDPSA